MPKNCCVRVGFFAELCLLALLPLMAAEARADDACGPICWLDAQDRTIDETKRAVEISRYVTNGDTLPHDERYADTSIAPTDLRVQIAAAPSAAISFAVLESRTPSGVLRSSLRVPLARPSADLPFRSPFVRLVGDATDLQAHGAESRALLVALRDRVVARYGEGPNAVERTVRVGAPGEESGPASARQARLVVHILRRAAGANPVIGRDETSALQLMREQVKAANQIWLQ
jgi:hypothetical protein